MQESKPQKISDLKKDDFVSMTGDAVIFSLSGYNRLSNIFLSPYERMCAVLTNKTYNSRKFVDEFFFVESLVRISDYENDDISCTFYELQLLGGESLERFAIYVNGATKLNSQYSNITFHMRLEQ